MRLPTICYCLIAGFACVSVAGADEPKPLTLTISQDRAKTTDALAVIQKESGATFVVDSTVIGSVSTAKVAFPSIPQMLDFIRTMEPGLTYQRLYLPTDKAVPNAAACYDLVRTLMWLAQQGNISMATQTGSIGIVRDTKPPTAAPAGMREIWYISDEQIRNQRFLDAQKAEKERMQASTAPILPMPLPTQHYNPGYPGGVNNGTPNYQFQRQQQQLQQQNPNQQGGTVQVSPGLIIQQ